MKLFVSDQTVLILGLGASGLAMARWCNQQGATVVVADTRANPPQLDSLRQQVPQAHFMHGMFTPALLDERAYAAVFCSPGLLPEQVDGLLAEARQRGIRTGGELGLFVQALAQLERECGYSPCLLGITGTNGKTTVTSLTSQLLVRAGKSVAVAGNIGPTLLDTLADHLHHNNLPDVWVLELSSFQLERDAASGFEPTAAVVLNITQDHLDWHGSLAQYAQAKAHIFGEKTLGVISRSDPLVLQMKDANPARKAESNWVTFGPDLPTRCDDYGLEQVNGMTWLVRAVSDDVQPRRKKSAEPQAFYIQRLMPADALRIRGRHNATNALAALALASTVSPALGPLLYGLREYRGEPHRVEPVAIVNDVEYFDDSKGTNVGATVAALGGLGADRKVVVILGGEGKGQDFGPLCEPVTQHARAAILIGRDAPLIRAALAAAAVPLTDAATLQEAVQIAARQAQAGDAVLLSPACASFDMFHNYEHRAQVFREAVEQLAQATGQV